MPLPSRSSAGDGERNERAVDLIADLLLAQKEDEQLRRRILFLARLPVFQRESLGNTGLQEMKFRGEPAEMRAAFSVLATEPGAALVIRALEPA